MDSEAKKQSVDNTVGEENNLAEFDFIKDKPHLIFLIKKAEKLSGAVHLVTSNLSHNEPLRTRLREESLALLKSAISFERESFSDASMESAISECVSLLDIGRASLLISNMNATVLRREYLNLLSAINSLYVREREQISFSVGDLAVNDVDVKEVGQQLISKGHSIKDIVLNDPLKARSRASLNVRPVRKSVVSSDSLRDKLILDVIRAKGDVAIKDVSVFVKGVSGKTIQRDLSRLVSLGTIKKSGKRRWSRYSLAS